jgi:hypothetical protein
MNDILSHALLGAGAALALAIAWGLAGSVMLTCVGIC